MDSDSTSSIPTGKVERAAKMLRAGTRVGSNYIRHFAKKAVGVESSQEALDQENAEDIFKTLTELRGSALKVAQMLSMDKYTLPKAYSDVFSLAQHSVPPLSGPLVTKTFRQYLGKAPHELYDRFEMQARHAASIGQVHEAWIGDQKLAVKIQYPGVADSVRSDLRLVRPIASRLFSMSEVELDRYFREVEGKMMEETDYELELRRGTEISAACQHIPHVHFATYVPELSSSRILTMQWLEGVHLREFLETNPSQEIRDQIGQALWDVVNHQVHGLKKVHADPHPGNYLMSPDGTLGVLDFGCVKEIPEDFYQGYFAFIHPEISGNRERMEKLMQYLELLHVEDTPDEREFFFTIFSRMVGLLSRPVMSEVFDFSDDIYFHEIFSFGEQLGKMPQLRQSKVARGSHHGLYINRTYIGVFTLLHELKARVHTRSEWIRSIDIAKLLA